MYLYNTNLFNLDTRMWIMLKLFLRKHEINYKSTSDKCIYRYSYHKLKSR